MLLSKKRRLISKKVRLVVVPDLGNLSRAEAENQLVEHRLVPGARPQYATGVKADRVIPNSQAPRATTQIKPGELVTFGVSVREEPPQTGDIPKREVSVSLELTTGEKIPFSRGGDGIYRCSINGKSAGLSASGYRLLLWLKPVAPSSESSGWYLQRPPANGIDNVHADGSWIGVAQLGNQVYHPNEGDVIEMAVSVADNDTFDKLMAESGVVMRNQPIGIKSVAARLVVTLRGE